MSTSPAILKSINVWEVISKNLCARDMLSLQRINNHTYEQLIPTVMRNRKLIPCIQGEANLFIKDKALYALEITNST
jgi:hypothetical protein